jgi:hypothetical protein
LNSSLRDAEKNATDKETVIALHGGGGCSDYAPQDDSYPKQFTWWNLLNNKAFERVGNGQYE